MHDREKAIKRLENTAEYFRHLQTVGYFGDQPVFREHEAHCNDAIALLKEQATVEHALEVLRQAGWTETLDVPFPAELLKEQEAVEPIPPTDESDLWRCGKCNRQLFRATNQMYCPYCGREVKWDD